MSGGRLIFDSEGKFRFAVKSRMNLVKNRFTDLDFLAEVAYSLPQELTEEGLTYRFALDSFFLLKKMIGIHLNYEMNQFKTTTSEQDQEVLEFGAAIKF
jgi:hypothetical protein